MLGPTSPSGRLAVWQQQVSSVDREPGHFALGDRRTEIGQGAGSRPPTSHNTGRTDHVSGVSRHLKRYCRYYGLCCCMAIPTSHEAGSPMAGIQPFRIMRATVMQCPSDPRGGVPCKYWASQLWACLPTPPRLHPLPVPSNQRFACSFLRIPDRSGRPCRSATTSPCRVWRGLSPRSHRLHHHVGADSASHGAVRHA